MSRTDKSKRVVYPPVGWNRYALGVQSVELASDEDIEWHWRHDFEGSVITGYTIMKKPEREKDAKR